MADNFGFKDGRNQAELALSPAAPLARKLAKFGSLKLNIGGKLKMPGAITKIGDITGSMRSQFGDIIKNKQRSIAFAGTLSTTLTAFDKNRNQAKAGNLVMGDPMFTGNAVGIPAATDFLSFSNLKPGEALPTSFGPLLDARKTQLAALTQRTSSVFATDAFKGVNVAENFDKTPYPLDNTLDLPSVPALSQGGAAAQNDPIVKDKRRFAVVGVHIGTGKPSFWSRLLSMAQVKAIPGLNPVVNQVFKDRKNSGSWSEPVSPLVAEYPYNRVTQTESGHAFEMDDTPGAERIHMFHRSGSFIEMHPDGTVVYKNLKDGYMLTMGDQFVKVGGSCHIAVDGNATLYTKGDVNVQSDGEINMQAKKDFNVYAANINLRAKKVFKADGVKMDLRYIVLPTMLMPVPMGGGFAPRINLAAIKADFPKSNILQVLANMAKNPLDPKNANVAIKFNEEKVALPPDNPLSNPGIYIKKGGQALAYRSRMFDSPEETDDIELYSAHVGLQQNLGDITGDVRKTGGKLFVLEGPTITNATSVPTVNYLNFDDFKGRFSYANDYSLGGTSFALRDVVDISLYPEIIAPLKPVPAPTVDTSIPDIQIEDPRPKGGGGSSGGGSDDDDSGSSPENGPWDNRLDVAKSVEYDYPDLVKEDSGAFADQLAHRLNRIDGTKKWGRKARNRDGSNKNFDVVTYQLDPNDFSKKKMIDVVLDVGGPDAKAKWSVVPSYEEEGNGYWAPPENGDLDK